MFVRSGHHSAPANRMMVRIGPGKGARAALLLVKEKSESGIHFYVEFPLLKMLAASSLKC